MPGLSLFVIPGLTGNLIHLDRYLLQAQPVRPDIQVVVRHKEKLIARIGPHHAQAGQLADLAPFQLGAQAAQAPAQLHAGLLLRHADLPAHLVEQQAPLFRRHLVLVERHLPVRRMDGGLLVRIGSGHHFGLEGAQIRNVNLVVFDNEIFDALRKKVDFHTRCKNSNF